MVHRVQDTRLLQNLLKSDKDYSSSFASHLAASHTSLASLSAYAAASPPDASKAILAVVSVLTLADDALRRYAASVDAWREELRAVLELEEEVGNVMRDREILVTRLIKASKQRPTRDSMLLASLPSPPSPPSSVLSKEPTNQKLSHAQIELQACEAHLATKERELGTLRRNAIKQGLERRCKALVECGWVWGEQGKEALRALESFSAVAESAFASKPLPPNGHSLEIDSQVSSLSPSQSASQTALPILPPPERARSPYRLDIPPAHAVSEDIIPAGRIQEENGSSSESDIGPVEIHDNPPPQRAFSIRSPPTSDLSHHVKFPGHGQNNSDLGPTTRPFDPNEYQSDRKRSTSFSLFGSIAGLFKSGSGKNQSVPPVPPLPSSGWQTRTDKHLLKRNRRGGDDSSSDEGVPASRSVAVHNLRGRSEEPGPSTAPAAVDLSKLAKHKRLVKKPSQRGLDQAPTDDSKGKGKQREISPHRLTKSGSIRHSKVDGPVRRATVDAPGSASTRFSIVPLDLDRPLTPTSPSVSRHASVLSKKASQASHPSKRSSLPPSRKGTDGDSPAGTARARPNGSANVNKSQTNLMTLVEDTRKPAALSAFSPPKMELARAPPSITQTPILHLPPPPLSAPPSAPSSSAVRSGVASGGEGSQTVTVHSPIPITLNSPPRPTHSPVIRSRSPPVPLRSALRHPSPTPAPAPPPATTSAPPPSSWTGRVNEDGETSSISSYETGHEDLDSRPVTPPKAQEPPPPPPPKHEDVSISSSSTQPARRKSVRLALTPSVSKTPPAVYEEDFVSWAPPPVTAPVASTSTSHESAKWATRIGSQVIGWDDSSEEDEEYGRARKALLQAAVRPT